MWKSRSKMKGHKMAWEWNWPTVWGFHYGVDIFHVSFRMTLAGDHSPGIHLSLIILNCKLIDCGYYNIFHELDEDEEEGEDGEPSQVSH
jgi:hypothetical protein